MKLLWIECIALIFWFLCQTIVSGGSSLKYPTLVSSLVAESNAAFIECFINFGVACVLQHYINKRNFDYAYPIFLSFLFLSLNSVTNCTLWMYSTLKDPVPGTVFYEICETLSFDSKLCNSAKATGIICVVFFCIQFFVFVISAINLWKMDRPWYGIMSNVAKIAYSLIGLVFVGSLIYSIATVYSIVNYKTTKFVLEGARQYHAWLIASSLVFAGFKAISVTIKTNYLSWCSFLFVFARFGNFISYAYRSCDNHSLDASLVPCSVMRSQLVGMGIIIISEFLLGIAGWKLKANTRIRSV